MAALTPLVLVVDDEAALRRFVVATLKHQGWAVEEVASGEGALHLVASLHPDVLLLDLGLPDLDGKEVVRRLRERHELPILVLSARDQEDEKVAALEAGADDYLTKPFGNAELVARIKVALRHRARDQGPATRQTWGPVAWWPEEQQVLVGGTPVHLTPMEYRLFRFLASSPGRLMTYGTLLREVWGHESLEQAPTVRVTVATLRRKLGEGAGLIQTEVGTGYRFGALVEPPGD